MYTRQEASQLRQEFWTTFGHYMLPLPSAGGEKVNWVNYKTGLPNVTFKMDGDNEHAWIGIILSHPDVDIRELYFEQFAQLKNLLHEELDEQWEWQEDITGEYGKKISKIYRQLDNVNVLHKADWPLLISFFKPRIMALDRFWDNAKYVFDALR